MKLTKSDKDAFVRACLDDVPQVDYNDVVRDKLMKFALSVMPDSVKVVYQLDPSWLRTSWVYTPGNLTPVCLPVLNGDYVIRDKYPELWAELVAMGDELQAQSIKLQDLRAELQSAIYCCSTLKQAKERLPEFEKYLPTDRDGTHISTLPVANLVADLTAAGWPKDQPLAQGA